MGQGLIGLDTVLTAGARQITSGLSSFKELAGKEEKKLVVFQSEAAMAMNLMKMWMIMVVVLLMMVADVKCESKEREQCTGQLIGLATCLPYVGGTAKQPTADCCKNLEQVLEKSKKCLCLLVRNRNDPSLGYKVNVSLASNLPTICKYDATISDCPKLLGLPANSPDAQAFIQLDKQMHRTPSENGGTGSEAVKTDKGKADRSMDLKMAAQISFLCFVSLLIVGV